MYHTNQYLYVCEYMTTTELPVILITSPDNELPPPQESYNIRVANRGAGVHRASSDFKTEATAETK